MAQDREAVRAQGRGAGRGEQGVGEDTTGQGDRVHSVPLPCQRAEPVDERDDGPVEAGGDQARRHARAQLADDRREHRCGVRQDGCRSGRDGRGGRPWAAGARHDGPVRVRTPHGEPVRARVPGGRRQRGGLQLDRRLRLVSGPVADTGQGGHGVEEAAHAGGGDAVQVTLQLPCQYEAFVGRAGGGAGQVVGPVDPGRPQMRERHPVRPVHGGVTTGQRHIREVPEPDEAVVVREQELAAPHRSVVAVPRAVEGDAEHRPHCRRGPLGHRGGDMGVMVLDAHDGPSRRVPASTSGRSGNRDAGRPPAAPGAPG